MRALTFLMILLWATQPFAKPMTPEQVPKPLKPWIDWVLLKHPELDCPVQYHQESRDCVWPGELLIEAHPAGASFTQTLTVYRESRVMLPGSTDIWPTGVQVNNKPAVVIEVQQSPAVLLQPGKYQIKGQFQWKRLPDAIKINPQTGIIRYRLNDKQIRHPQLRNNKLWLQAGQQRETDKAPEDRLTLEVYRLLSDGHPFQVTTELNIEVSGSQREVLLGKPLLDGFIPLQLNSALPARIEPDGQIRVQVRPGRWQLRLVARHTGNLTSLAMPTQDVPWPAHEVWVYRAAHQDRLTEVQNVVQIDPRQVRLPRDWSNLPAYRITPDDKLIIKVIRRGDPDPEPDQLTLQRDLWLDFSGQGYTIRDTINGKMTHDWRLSVDPELALGRVTIDGKPQFITRLKDDKRQGVEVRRGQLNLVAESRYDGSVRYIPAIGWGRDLQQVKATLHLPPGWQLLTVTGVDNVPASWVQRWTLYDLFLVLIATIAAGKLWGWKWSPLVLVSLALTWHEPGAPRMVWLYLLATIALLRAVPTGGKFHKIITSLQRLGFLALLIIALPFMVQQARNGLYPQLERPSVTPHSLQTPAKQRVSAPAAAIDAMKEMKRSTVGKVLSRVEVMGGMGDSGSYDEARDTLEQIDPNANIQTGPGLPNWQWHTVQLNWSGPVAADQQIGLYLIGPTLHLILNFLIIGLIVALSWRFIDHRPGKGSLRRLGELLVIPLAFVTLMGAPSDTMAQDFPPPALLQELENRLTEIPIPAPRATITELSLQIRSSTYQGTLQVQALQDTAIPLPIDTRQITPVRVQIDRKGANAQLYRTQHNQLWLVVPKGRHQVDLVAWLPVADQLQIPLPLRPHWVTLDVKDWSVEGINREGVPDQQLSLTRIRSTDETATEELTPSALPPFVRVERTLIFGIHWEAHTRVRRISPTGSALSMQIPLITGASVVTEGFRVKDGKVLVNMAAAQREVSWRSRLDPVNELTLTAVDNSGWLETWRTNIGPIWHVTIEGIPPIHHQDAANNWIPAWHPWPGEQVTLKVQRPAGVTGDTMTIDDSSLTVKPGKRVTDATLTFTLRASQGGRHDLQLPESVQLQSVKINGRTQPIRQDNQIVSLPVVPGVQRYELHWRDMSGTHAAWQTPAFSLAGKSVNARLTAHIPRDRWTLWVSGPDLGPAVLFWGVLLILVLIAGALSRVSAAASLPLGFVSWLLLGIGLSQVTVFSGILVVGWFFILYARSQMDAETAKWRFNLTQIIIVLLTFSSLSVLLWVVKEGLLGLPEMQIKGYRSDAYVMNWYQDRVADTYPQAFVLSVPLLVYRLLMLAWALWLAFSLLKWLKWGWLAFSTGGLWRSVKIMTNKSRKPGADHGPSGKESADP